MEIAEIKVSYTPMKFSKNKIRNSKDIFQIGLQIWNKDTIEMQEEVKVIFLNRACEIIGFYELSKGGMSGSIIDIKLLMSVALKCLVSNIIIVHNHPTGNLTPSVADKNVTNEIKNACSYLDMKLLDHIIISNDDFYSFSDDGKL